MAIGMNYVRNDWPKLPNCGPASLAVVSIIQFDQKRRICENLLCFLETKAVLSLILPTLVEIPFESLQSSSLILLTFSSNSRYLKLCPANKG